VLTSSFRQRLGYHMPSYVDDYTPYAGRVSMNADYIIPLLANDTSISERLGQNIMVAKTVSDSQKRERNRHANENLTACARGNGK